MDENQENIPRRRRPKAEVPMVHDKNRRLVPVDPGKDKPYLAFLGGIDREELLTALETSGDDRFKALVQAMTEPRFRHFKLVTLMRRCCITLQDAQAFWRDCKLQEGIARMMRHLPQGMEDTAIDALSGSDLCERCMGLGYVAVKDTQKTCPRCKGSGETRLPGDKTARQLIFEASGLTGKSSPLVAIQQNFGDGLDSLEQSAQTVEKMISGPKNS